MREFFKPWRRKLGVLTLLMACGFMGLWFRGLSYCDEFEIRFQPINASISCTSANREIAIGIATGNFGPRTSFYSLRTEPITTEPIEELDPGETLPQEEDEDRLQSYGLFKLGQYGGGSGDGLKSMNYSGTAVIISNDVLIVPLTLFSLWLLLSRARKSTPAISVGPDPAK